MAINFMLLCDKIGKDLAEEFEDAARKLNAAKTRFDADNAATARLIAEKITLENQKAKLKIKVSNLETENYKLDTKVFRLESDKSRLESNKYLLESRVSALQLDISALETRVSHSKSEKSELETKISQLEIEKSEMEKRMSQQEKDKLKLETQASDLLTNMSALETKVSQLDSEKSEMKKIISQMEKDKSELETQVCDLVSRNSTFETKVSLLESYKPKLNITVSGLESNKSTLDKRVSQLENNKRKLEAEQNQNKEKIQQLNDKVLELGKLANRKTSHMIPARQLGIIWGDTPEYWVWKFSPSSMHEEVAELRDVCWLEIGGSMSTKDLIPKITYSVFLVFKLKDNHRGFESPPSEAFVGIRAGDQSTRNVLLVANGVHRHDGWMELELGQRYVTDNNSTLEMSLKETGSNQWKSGLVVQGIEVRAR